MHLEPFSCLTKLGAKWAELVQMFVPRSRVRIFCNKRNDPPHWTLNWYFGDFQTIWVHWGPFGCLTKLGTKRTELVQTFMPRSRVRIICNERTRSTPLDPKLMFCRVSYRWRAFGTVTLPYETRGKTFRTSAKVRATKSHRNFSHQTHPIHPLDPKLKILVRFLLFGCIWNRLVALRNSVQNGPN